MYVNAPRYLLRKHCILKMIKNMPLTSILEIGCGAGDLSETLFKKGGSVKGIDFSDEAIAICEERRRKLNEPAGLQFSTESIFEIHDPFDMIFICEVLEHIEDDVSALRHIHSVLKEGGLLICSVPAHKSKLAASDRYVGHFRRYDKKDIIALLVDNGFKIDTLWSYGVPLANVTETIRNRIYANKPKPSKEVGSKQSGTNRSIEYQFRYLLNNIVLFPFYIVQQLFFNMDIGTGYIIKARKKGQA